MDNYIRVKDGTTASDSPVVKGIILLCFHKQTYVYTKQLPFQPKDWFFVCWRLTLTNNKNKQTKQENSYRDGLKEDENVHIVV